jgi:hypothetical protein
MHKILRPRREELLVFLATCLSGISHCKGWLPQVNLNPQVLHGSGLAQSRASCYRSVCTAQVRQGVVCKMSQEMGDRSVDLPSNHGRKADAQETGDRSVDLPSNHGRKADAYGLATLDHQTNLELCH